MKPLEGKVAVVAGATRGAGRGIACGLAEAGARVYCTGRSVRGKPAMEGRPETIEETAELVTARGGVGVAVQVDHLDEAQVRGLVERVRGEQGRLDVLVNDVWGGDALTEFGKPFWELSIERGLALLRTAVHSHIITNRHAAPLLIETAHRAGRALIVEITDGDFFGYRGNLFYDLAKVSAIRLAFAMARELRRKKVTALAVTPGFLRSEAMLERFGVTEANWREGARKEPDFIASETPLYVGRAVAALATDPQVGKKSGRVFSSWGLSREYGFTDADGSRPDWGKHFEATYRKPLRSADDADYASWFDGPMEAAFPEWP